MTIHFFDCSDNLVDYSKQAAITWRIEWACYYIAKQIEYITLNICKLKVMLKVSSSGQWTSVMSKYKEVL